MREPFVEPMGENFAANEFRVAQDIAKKSGVCFNARNRILRQCTLQPRNGLSAVAPPGNQFSEQRVVVGRHREAVVDAFVESDAWARRNASRKNCSWRRKKIIIRIF